MTDLTINERLAVLETKMDDVQSDAAKRDAKQDTILEKLTAMEATMSSAKSILGLVGWMLTSMVAVVWKIGPWLYNFFRAKTGNG